MELKDLTYEDVAELCNTMRAKAEKLSIRAINRQLGGSFSTISKLYKRWQDEIAAANNTDTELAATFKHAILAEVNRVSAAAQAKLQAQLDSSNAQLKETSELMQEAERGIAALQEQLLEMQAAAETTKLNYEKELAAASAIIKDNATREASLKAELTAMRERVHGAELKAATLDGKLQAIDQQRQKLAPAKK